MPMVKDTYSPLVTKTPEASAQSHLQTFCTDGGAISLAYTLLIINIII